MFSMKNAKKEDKEEKVETEQVGSSVHGRSDRPVETQQMWVDNVDIRDLRFVLMIYCCT